MQGSCRGAYTLRRPSEEAEAQRESRRGPRNLMLLASARCISPYTVRSCTLSKSQTATCPFLSPLTTMLSCMYARHVQATILLLKRTSGRFLECPHCCCAHRQQPIHSEVQQIDASQRQPCRTRCKHSSSKPPWLLLWCSRLLAWESAQRSTFVGWKSRQQHRRE